MPKSLPTEPNLEHLKNEAKALLKSYAEREPSVCNTLKLLRRFSGVSVNAIMGASVSLQEVQYALALDYGYKSWNEMRRHVMSVTTKPKDTGSKMVEMKVKKVGYCDKDKQLAQLVLCDQEEKRFLPIYIGTSEALAIAAELQGAVYPRPRTHDLFRGAVDALGGEICAATITGLKDSTYFASLLIKNEGREVELDARPSDAIALAVRFNAPIRVDQKTFQDVSVDESQLSSTFEPIVVGDTTVVKIARPGGEGPSLAQPQ